MTLDPIIDRFRAYLRNNRSESTAIKYAQSAERLIEFCSQQRLDLRNLPPGILTLFAEYLRASNLRPSSVHTMTAGAKKFLGWLHANGVVQGQDFLDPDLPKIIHETPNAASTEDLVAFLAHAAVQNEPQRTAVMLLPYCGLRSNELTRLTLHSIKKVIYPDRNGDPTPHLGLHVEGKGGDRRFVPLLPDGIHILIHYLQTWRRYQPSNSVWLFPMADGSPIANRTLRHYVQMIRQNMGKGGDRLTPHTMRRTYATTLHLAGLDAITLTKIMGHKNVQTTMAHYLQVTPVNIAGAVGRSGAVLISRGPEADAVANAGRGVHELLEKLNKKED